MKVHLHATFHLIAGVKSFPIDLPPGARVMDAVREILRLHPALAAHWLDANGSLRPHVHVFVDGEEAPSLPDGLQTALTPRQMLDFFPPLAGG